MPFRGAAPLGTLGGQDTPDLLQIPPDVRIAVGGTYIAYLLVNGPLTIRQRSAIETVVRTLGAKGQTTVVIIVREDGAIIETDTEAFNFGPGIEASSTSPGVVFLEIPAGAITADMLAAAIVTAGKIAAGAVGNAAIADGAITSAKILDGTIATADIANLAITNDKLGVGSVSEDELAAGSVTSTKIGLNSITSTKIVDANITTPKLLDEAVTGAKIANDTISWQKLIAGSIFGYHALADNSVPEVKLQDNIVSNRTYIDRSIDPVHLSLLAARPEVIITFETPVAGLAASSTVITHDYTPPVGQSFRHLTFGSLQAEGSSSIGVGSLRCDMGAATGTALAANYEQGVDTSHLAILTGALVGAAGTPMNFDLEWVRTSGTINTKSGFLCTIIWPYA